MNRHTSIKRMELHCTLENLALPKRQIKKLFDFVNRVENGEIVCALFSGGNEIEKALAARILAAELSIDLYRVDLSGVVNKYIGETEKNLNQVLSRAEELDVIFLLDEGDSLLSKRTEVRTANDRYANVRTNYDLQREEKGEVLILEQLKKHHQPVIVIAKRNTKCPNAFIYRIKYGFDYCIHFPLSKSLQSRQFNPLGRA